MAAVANEFAWSSKSAHPEHFVLRMRPISRPCEFFVNNRSLKNQSSCALVLLCSDIAKQYDKYLR